MSGSEAFFQVAVALIPGLLFGGALLELRSGPDRTHQRRRLALIVVGFLIVCVPGEIFAIRGAIDPSVSKLEQRYVVFVVVSGTVAIAAWTAAPWLKQAFPRPRTRLYVMRLAVVALVASAVLAQLAVTGSLNHARARRALDDASDSLRMHEDALNTAVTAVSTAETELLSSARALSRRDQRFAAPILAAFRGDLGNATSGFSASTVSAARLDKGVDDVNAAHERLRDRFQNGRPTASAEIELVLLAADRLTTAEAVKIIDFQIALRARKEYAAACRDAAFLGCRRNAP